MKFNSLVLIIFNAIILNSLSLFAMHNDFVRPSTNYEYECRILLNTPEFYYLTAKQKETLINKYKKGSEKAANNRKNINTKNFFKPH